jgi:hypothetical protein
VQIKKSSRGSANENKAQGGVSVDTPGLQAVVQFWVAESLVVCRENKKKLKGECK